MILSLENIGKRFKYNWVFRHIDLQIQAGQYISVKGPNGSGKSTLLQIISGYLPPSQGKITFSSASNRVKEYSKECTYAAPYIDLINQFTLMEVIRFHSRFRKFKNDLSLSQVIDILDLKKSENQFLHEFSSGMLQRVRLGLAILSESKICLLDEPSTNLDNDGFEWYSELLKSYQQDTAIVIASNEDRDFVRNDIDINILNFKS